MSIFEIIGFFVAAVFVIIFIVTYFAGGVYMIFDVVRMAKKASARFSGSNQADS